MLNQLILLQKDGLNTEKDAKRKKKKKEIHVKKKKKNIDVINTSLFKFECLLIKKTPDIPIDIVTCT